MDGESQKRQEEETEELRLSYTTKHGWIIRLWDDMRTGSLQMNNRGQEYMLCFYTMAHQKNACMLPKMTITAINPQTKIKTADLGASLSSTEHIWVYYRPLLSASGTDAAIHSKKSLKTHWNNSAARQWETDISTRSWRRPKTELKRSHLSIVVIIIIIQFSCLISSTEQYCHTYSIKVMLSALTCHLWSIFCNIYTESG